MKADTNPLKTIFGKEVQYVVPLYQRPYVWREQTHWAPLWEDILSVVRQMPENSDSQEIEIAPHFLGAVVLDQQRTSAGSIERRHVIDGQQRLTTLQLLIAAGSRVASEEGFDREGRQLKRLVANEEDYVTDEVDAYKIWPTNVDRRAFASVMTASDGEPLDVDDPFNLIHEAYSYFLAAFREQLDSLEGDRASWLANVAQSIRNHIQIVIIDLEERDNPQVIFETLNARGTPLLAIDLVKNLLFLRAEKAGQDVERLYKEHWRQLERTYWREELRQGRLTRPRAEIFLMHWLTMKRREETLSHHLYNTFRSLTDEAKQSTASLLEEFANDAKIFEGFDNLVAGTPEHRFFKTLTILDTSTVFPLVLALYKAPLEEEKRQVAVAALESWLVRRMLCGLTPANYNRFILELLNLIARNEASGDQLLLERLTSADAVTNRWPDDAELVEALTHLRFYGRLSQPRLRLVLSAIERELRSSKSETMDLPENLTIEHVLPQKWRENWPTDPPGDLALENERELRVHRIGNLTLVNGSLNAPMSNAPWSKKRIELDKHSLLMLNRHLVNENPEGWSEDRIDARSHELAAIVAEVWPGPGAAWNAAARHHQLQDHSTGDAAPQRPSAEDLIDIYAAPGSAALLRQFLEEISFWESVSIKVGQAKQDQWRRIYIHRKGSPYGAFCRIFPQKRVARFRLDLVDVPFANEAEAVDVPDPYRVRLFFSSHENVSEGLAIARHAWDRAIPEEEGF